MELHEYAIIIRFHERRHNSTNFLEGRIRCPLLLLISKMALLRLFLGNLCKVKFHAPKAARTTPHYNIFESFINNSFYMGLSAASILLETGACRRRELPQTLPAALLPVHYLISSETLPERFSTRLKITFFMKVLNVLKVSNVLPKH